MGGQCSWTRSRVSTPRLRRDRSVQARKLLSVNSPASCGPPASHLGGHGELGGGVLAQEPADNLLAAAIAVDVGGVEEGDPGVDGGAQHIRARRHRRHHPSRRQAARCRGRRRRRCGRSGRECSAASTEPSLQPAAATAGVWKVGTEQARPSAYRAPPPPAEEVDLSDRSGPPSIDAVIVALVRDGQGGALRRGRGGYPGPVSDQVTRATAPGQLTGLVIVVALVSAVSGMLYGYDTGIISGALLQITKEFDIAEGWKQVIAASILLGAVIGALTCSLLSERRGRKGTILLIWLWSSPSARCACSFSPNPVHARRSGGSCSGFAVGGATQTVPMYVAELAPPKLPGPARARASSSPSASASSSRQWSGPASRSSGGCRSASAAVPAADHVAAAAAAAGEPALAGQARRPRGRPRGAATRAPDGYDVDHELDEIVRAQERKQETSEQPRLERTASALGPAGAGSRLRHRDLHPAVRASR